MFRNRGGAALIAALLVIALQMALGGMLSARRELLSCTTLPSCDGRWWPRNFDVLFFNPFAANGDVAGDGSALVLGHRFGAIAVALIIGALALRALRAGGRAARIGTLLFVLLVIQGALGFSIVLIERPLALAVLHNFCAALLIATLVALLWPKEKTGP